ncbi:MAG: MoaD/ThiS family protein [Candidatus Thorarchaeota archaeon]
MRYVKIHHFNIGSWYVYSGACRILAEIFVKLMAKGLHSKEHDMFPYDVAENTTIYSLIDHLYEDFGEKFEVYFEDNETRTLRRDTVVLINGANMVSKEGLATRVKKGDLIVFMIAAVGG